MTKLEIEHGEGRAALESQHHDTTNEICQRGKLTLTLFQSLMIIALLSSIGRVTSGRWWFDHEASQVRRLADENNRLDNEINLLRHKIGKRGETLLILQGIAVDNPNLLERSKTTNPNRTDFFEFINWMKPDELVAFMFRNEAFNCLAWVMSQENWYSCLNEKTFTQLTEWEAKTHKSKLKRTVKKALDYGPVFVREL